MSMKMILWALHLINNDELDDLAECELNFDNDEFYDRQELSDDAATKQLLFPFSKQEPSLSPDEL